MQRGNKFNAVKTVVDGITFDSKREAKRYGELKLLERAGKIKALSVHPKYDLLVHGVLISTYKPDFFYVDLVTPGFRIEDVKSPPTAKKRDFILIKKLMKAIHGIEVEVLL